MIGAVAGGVLGNVIGGGGKNTAAKIAGAAAGGYAGNKTQEHLQANDTYQTTERVCKTVYDESERTVAYNVDYKIGDVPGKVRLDHDPGDTIPVQDGQLVIAREASASESGSPGRSASSRGCSSVMSRSQLSTSRSKLRSSI